MRWLTYFILAYLALGVQIGAGEFLRFGGAKPDLVLLAVVYIAINASREAALLGAFFMGLMTDLVGLHALGLYALAYALAAMFIVSTQEIVNREHPLTHVSLALVASLMVSAVALVQGWIFGPPPSPGAHFSTALYTALLAPIVLGVLQRMKRIFAFKPRRRVGLI